MSKKIFDRLRIDMWISGTADKEGNGGYAALLHSEIAGNVYRKTVGGYALDSTVTRMTLKALVEGLKQIKSKSIIHIYTSLPSISAGLNKNMYIWEKKDWKRKDGGFLKHSDLWQQVFHLLEEKTISYKVHLQKDAPHQYNELHVLHTSSKYAMEAKRMLYEVSLTS